MRVLMLVLGLGLTQSLPALSDTLRVASAANFKSTLLLIAESFKADTDHDLRISAASTGVLYNQILHGAPFDILLAADTEKPELLERQGYVLAGSRFTYAYGRLVLAYRPALAPIAAGGIAAVLTSPGLDLVIANPGHAPYGRAAAAVLAKHTLAPDARLLRAANVSQAYQMWFTSGADATLVGKSYAPENFLVVASSLYPPLEQQAVILKTTSNPALAERFMEFMQSAPIRKLIEARGYATRAATHD
jgi:molybdate transport system substrate-binding protein